MGDAHFVSQRQMPYFLIVTYLTAVRNGKDDIRANRCKFVLGALGYPAQLCSVAQIRAEIRVGAIFDMGSPLRSPD